jgi:ABC-type uncharacterized transport system permease subunit
MVAAAISQRAVVATLFSWLLLWETSNLKVSSVISTTAVNCIVPKLSPFISVGEITNNYLFFQKKGCKNV